MLGKALTTAAAGAAGAAAGLGIEDVFSTWLYTGNGSTQTITNGIDLAGEGGMVWFKQRGGNGTADGHALCDTARGTNKQLNTRNTNGEVTIGAGYDLTAFNSNGFSLGGNWLSLVNNISFTYASWTFRKAEKFFDVVTYTGNGSNRTIAHNLGSVPGCIIVKRTDTTGDWQVYHRANTAAPETDYLVLNSTAATADSDTRWNDTLPTSTVFSLGTDATVNASGGTYVAYLFAHDAGGFGDSGNDNVVSCGSFTANGSGIIPTVTLGWEPQWLLVRASSEGGQWYIFDNMRGISTGGNDAYLMPAASNAEASGSFVDLTATGFTGGASAMFSAGATGIYIAIRRGPMKTPTDATTVFDTRTLTQAYNTTTPAVASVTTDLFITGIRGFSHDTWVADRMRGAPHLMTNTTGAEAGSNYYKFDVQTGVAFGVNLMGSNNVFQHFFRRAPGFFDVVAYTGDGVNNRSIPHNLAVIPELVIYKCRSNGATQWFITHSSFAADTYLWFTVGAPNVFSGTFGLPTSTNLVVGNASGGVNDSGRTYIAYLFATCPGVSKVGSYTGTANTLQIDCGFTTGARFVLIRRTDNTGDWYVWDSARGIVAGNDPYLLINSTAPEVTNTDYIDPLNSGFEISSTAPAAINADGGSFLYLAIA